MQQEDYALALMQRAGLLTLIPAVPLAWAFARTSANPGGAAAVTGRNGSCTQIEELWLEAQSVPSASRIPCIQAFPAGVRRFRTQGPAGTPQVVDVFPGACLSYQPEPGIGPSARLLDQAQRAVAFRTRDELREALRHRSGGRLQLDPEGGNSQGIVFGYQVRRFGRAAVVMPELYEGRSPDMPGWPTA